jgi:hypothetical protein
MTRIRMVPNDVVFALRPGFRRVVRTPTRTLQFRGPTNAPYFHRKSNHTPFPVLIK